MKTMDQYREAIHSIHQHNRNAFPGGYTLEANFETLAEMLAELNELRRASGREHWDGKSIPAGAVRMTDFVCGAAATLDRVMVHFEAYEKAFSVNSQQEAAQTARALRAAILSDLVQRTFSNGQQIPVDRMPALP